MEKLEAVNLMVFVLVLFLTKALDLYSIKMANIMKMNGTGCFYKGQGGPEFYLNCFHLLLTEKVRLMDYAG